jgi:N-acetylglutamate synthase-like GNAT family acetyltransferase
MPATFRTLCSVDDPLWPSLIALYEASFPIEERDPTQSLVSELAGKGRLQTQFVVAEEGGCLVGFCRSAELAHCDATWIIHIAVLPESQSSGVGGSLIDHVRSKCPGRLLLAEVDRLEDALSEEDLRLRERRMRWFRALGAEMVTRTYTQPALGPGGRAVRMYLLRIGAVSVPNEELIRAFYREAWQMDPSEAHVALALQGAV